MLFADVDDRDICRGMFVKDLSYFVIPHKFLSYRHKPYSMLTWETVYVDPSSNFLEQCQMIDFSTSSLLTFGP